VWKDDRELEEDAVCAAVAAPTIKSNGRKNDAKHKVGGMRDCPKKRVEREKNVSKNGGKCHDVVK
jgi:hypothetical protein